MLWNPIMSSDSGHVLVYMMLWFRCDARFKAGLAETNNSSKIPKAPFELLVIFEFYQCHLHHQHYHYGHHRRRHHHHHTDSYSSRIGDCRCDPSHGIAPGSNSLKNTAWTLVSRSADTLPLERMHDRPAPADGNSVGNCMHLGNLGFPDAAGLQVRMHSVPARHTGSNYLPSLRVEGAFGCSIIESLSAVDEYCTRQFYQETAEAARTRVLRTRDGWCVHRLVSGAPI